MVNYARHLFLDSERKITSKRLPIAYIHNVIKQFNIGHFFFFLLFAKATYKLYPIVKRFVLLSQIITK